MLAATILFIATNAALIGVSRLVYSMGIHRQLPDALRRLHPRFRTPWIGILLFGAAAIVTLLPGQADFLGYMYAFGAMLSFTIAHVAVMRLRATEPDFPRPYRGPGNITVRGYDLPLFAVVGLFGTSVAFVVTAALHPEVAVAGFGWLALGLLLYVAYRRRQGLDLRSTHKVAIPQPVVDHEAEYDSVLVPLFDGGYDEHVMATAAKLAARKRRGIHVLALVDGAERAADPGAHGRGGGSGQLLDRAGQGPGWPPGLGPQREDPPGASRAPNRRGGDRDARRRHRHGPAATDRRRVALRQDDRDRSRGTPVPGRHRVHAR